VPMASVTKSVPMEVCQWDRGVPMASVTSRKQPGRTWTSEHCGFRAHSQEDCSTRAPAASDRAPRASPCEAELQVEKRMAASLKSRPASMSDLIRRASSSDLTRMCEARALVCSYLGARKCSHNAAMVETLR
jgi:hypothetical protein